MLGVPAHTGGVDLRYEPLLMAVPAGPVPAHTGGVDLRYSVHRDLSGSFVPVHTSGVDLRPDVGR